jgi:hypothetical protein
VARGSLVLLLRAQGLLQGRHERRRGRRRTSPTAAGPRRARTSRPSAPPSPSTPASSRPPLSRAQAARPACWPTTRQPWSSWARGIPGVIADLTPDKKALPDLGWFPFPATTGGAGDPSAMMGGSDGFACLKNAPAACVQFLNFIASKSQPGGVRHGVQDPSGQPAGPGASSATRPSRTCCRRTTRRRT